MFRRPKLEALKSIYNKGNAKDRSALDLKDCGVAAFRDKVLAHPVNKIKAILDKEEYAVSLNWETIQETIDKITGFCSVVETHNWPDWKTEHFLGETGEGAGALKDIVGEVHDAAQYRRLRIEVSKRALTKPPRIVYDWNAKQFVLLDEKDSQ